MIKHCLACGREIEEQDTESSYCEDCDQGMIDDPHDEEDGPYGYDTED